MRTFAVLLRTDKGQFPLFVAHIKLPNIFPDVRIVALNCVKRLLTRPNLLRPCKIDASKLVSPGFDESGVQSTKT